MTENSDESKKALLASLFVSSVLFSGKMFFGLVTGSVAILASALDSGLDFFSSLINMFALLTAQKPADSEHRFGHGKAEALAGLVQGVVIFVSGAYLFYQSILRFIVPEELTELGSGIWVMTVSLVLTMLLVSYQKYISKKTESLVVEADTMHYLTDIISNAVVLIALGVYHLSGYIYADAIAGLGGAIYVFWGSITIIRQSFSVLMDADISDKYRESLIEVINRYNEKVFGYHDLRTRSAGIHDYMDFHLEMDREMTLEESHDLVESIMGDLKKMHPQLETMIHSDPVVVNKDGQKVRLLDNAEPRFY